MRTIVEVRCLRLAHLAPLAPWQGLKCGPHRAHHPCGKLRRCFGFGRAIPGQRNAVTLNATTPTSFPTAPGSTFPALPEPKRLRLRRASLRGALVALLVVAQSLRVWLTVNCEGRAQEQAEAASAGAAADVRQLLSRNRSKCIARGCSRRWTCDRRSN